MGVGCLNQLLKLWKVCAVTLTRPCQQCFCIKVSGNSILMQLEMMFLPQWYMVLSIYYASLVCSLLWEKINRVFFLSKIALKTVFGFLCPHFLNRWARNLSSGNRCSIQFYATLVFTGCFLLFILVLDTFVCTQASRSIACWYWDLLKIQMLKYTSYLSQLIVLILSLLHFQLSCLSYWFMQTLKRRHWQSCTKNWLTFWGRNSNH